MMPPRDLPSTHWSLVRDAGRQTGEAKRRALGQLLSRYLEPMARHLRLKFHLDPERAEELVQGFVAKKVLENDLCRAAEEARGRFRNFLLTALDRYVIDQHHAAHRDGLAGAAPLEDAATLADPAPSPADLFDVLWARQVIADAAAMMKEHCHAAARPDLWHVFDERILVTALGERPPTPYADLARRFGWTSPEQGSNLLVTAKRMFGRNLRAVVGRYERDPEDVEREVAHLREILSNKRARALR